MIPIRNHLQINLEFSTTAPDPHVVYYSLYCLPNLRSFFHSNKSITNRVWNGRCCRRMLRLDIEGVRCSHGTASRKSGGRKKKTSRRGKGPQKSSSYASFSPTFSVCEGSHLDVEDPLTPQRLRAKQGVRQRPAPAITARSWVVGDLLTGKVLWNRCGKEVLPMASITKALTAHCVLTLCNDNRVDIHEEYVVVSRQAARTIGTTANLKEGDEFSIFELMHGMMLPSGNDAAMALAEHMGNHYLGSGAGIELFVDYMNEMAKHIGMKNTTIRNPHGMDQSGHSSTCFDIAKLGSVVMKARKGVFRKIVKLKSFTCKPHGGSRVSRYFVWENTNKLLSRNSAAFGLKTGVTRNAGPCLLSCARLANGLEMLVVTLNSASRQCRWQEHNSMYNWARQNLGISRLTSSNKVKTRTTRRRPLRRAKSDAHLGSAEKDLQRIASAVCEDLLRDSLNIR